MSKVLNAAAGGLTLVRIALIGMLAFPTAGIAAAQDDSGPSVAIVLSASGPMLADEGGWSLYTWDGDESGMSYCYDACSSIWPPFITGGYPTALDSLPGTLDIIARDDGSWQATYDGWPLYYYGGDLRPGDARGDSLVAFGARWYAVRIGTPAPVASTEPPSAPPFSFGPRAPSFSFPVPVSPPTFSQPQGGLPPFAPQAPSIGPAGPPGYPPYPYSVGPYPPPPPGYPYGGPGEPVPYGPPNQGVEPGAFVPGIPLPYGIGGLPLGGPVDPSTFPTSALTVAPPSGAIGVTWSNTPSARSFRVYYSTASGTPNFASIQTLNQSVGTSVTTTTIGGLSPGTSYLFQVRGVDANGVERGVPSSTTLGPTTGQNTIGSPILPSTGPIETPPAPPPLAAPSGVAVTATSSTTANLNWTGGGAAVSYQVAQALSPTGPFNVAAASTTSSTTVSGLTTNTTYYFQVRAVDGAGNLSTPSETVSTTTPADFVVTIGVSVMGTTSTTATLSWTPISTAKSYQIGQASTAAGPFPSVMVSPTSMATVGNLTPNTTYYFQIRALDAAGNILGGPSSTASVTTSS